MQNTQEYGVGIEMEGFLVTSTGPIVRVKNQPTSEYVREKVVAHLPQLAENISFEQASVMLEVKSAVHTEAQLALQEIMRIRQAIDDLLSPEGINLIFQPVLSEQFEFVAATSDPDSRTNQLIREWSGTPQGQNLLYSTAIAALQINDSRPFRGINRDSEKLEKARLLHNRYSQIFPQLTSLNSPQRDYRGYTRLENLFYLMHHVKKDRFQKAGYPRVDNALMPPYFADVEAMKRWMCAHSDVIDFAEAECKNEHAATIKTKRRPAWLVETRCFDATDNPEILSQMVKANQQALEPFLAT